MGTHKGHRIGNKRGKKDLYQKQRRKETQYLDGFKKSLTGKKPKKAKKSEAPTGVGKWTTTYGKGKKSPKGKVRKALLVKELYPGAGDPKPRPAESGCTGPAPGTVGHQGPDRTDQDGDQGGADEARAERPPAPAPTGENPTDVCL